MSVVGLCIQLVWSTHWGKRARLYSVQSDTGSFSHTTVTAVCLYSHRPGTVPEEVSVGQTHIYGMQRR